MVFFIGLLKYILALLRVRNLHRFPRGFFLQHTPGGQVLTRFDADTGARLSSSPIMPGFLSQNTPLCAPDGLVFYPRTQDNPIVEFFYALRDTDTGFEQVWNAPGLAGADSHHGITADGGDLRAYRTEPACA
jgi:hypothetical protein